MEFNNPFGGNMFGKVENGMCKLSMSGNIAVKTSTGYKVYNAKTGNLTNCDNLVIDIGSDCFFVVPCNRVKSGDIILVNSKPHYVISVDKNEIKTLNYEDSEISTILPERHLMFGRQYMYRKIVSMFGSNIADKKNGKGFDSFMKYAMISSMMGGNNGMNFGTNSSNMLPMMMLMNGSGFDNMFTDMFDGMDEDNSVVEEEGEE